MSRKVSRRKAAKGEKSPPERGKGGTSKKKIETEKTREGTHADLELVQRFKEGDSGAFDAIFETYSGPLLGFLTRMSRRNRSRRLRRSC